MRQAEIWRVQITFGGGREQAGERPALILQADPFIKTLPLILAVPFTIGRK